jgi:lipid-binding SYLF domain-containing protein
MHGTMPNVCTLSLRSSPRHPSREQGTLIRRLRDGRWSGPVALGTFGIGVGLQMGGRKTDTMLFLMDDHAIAVFSKVGIPTYHS